MNFIQSPPGQEPVIVEGYFAFPRDRVFAAWTDPEKIVRWFGRGRKLEKAETEIRDGGRWRFSLSSGENTEFFEGTYLEVIQQQKLKFSWQHVIQSAKGERQATPVSTVEVEFEDRGNGTYVRLVHSGIATEAGRRGVGGGWDVSFAAIDAALKTNAI